MFNAARLRLTFWYLAILVVIVGLLSVVLYRILVSLQQAELQSIGPKVREGIEDLFARDEGTLAVQIIALDAGVLILAALGAYVLAGRTLAPIAQSMERQQRFAAAASHELRTPLTVLQGSMEVALLNRRTPEEYERVLIEATGEAHRLGMLVADLLALSRVQRDGQALALELVDMREVIEAVVDSLRPLAAGKCQSLEVRLDRTLLVYGDPLKLRQVVTNLLDNAVTYTQRGGRVELSARRERNEVHVHVRDSGPGIAPEHLSRLFEPFYRIDDARSGDSTHSGLGLAIASWIVHAHHGRLDVESNAGTGTVFTMKLPAVV
jgi:two-component system sensor histidine kinase CiaH